MSKFVNASKYHLTIHQVEQLEEQFRELTDVELCNVVITPKHKCYLIEVDIAHDGHLIELVSILNISNVEFLFEQEYVSNYIVDMILNFNK